MRAQVLARKGLTFLISIISVAPLALAEESSSHSNLSTFIGQLINFLVLFGGLAYFLKKPIDDYLKKKSEQIAELLKKSEENKIESAKKLEEIKVRLGRLDEEIKKMKEQASAEAWKEKERIRTEAQQEAERLKKLASEEINSLVRASIQELKAYTIELSVALTEQKIKEKLSPELHRKMIKKAIDNLRTFYESSVGN